MTKRYGALVALDSVGIDLVPGEVHAVLGENGAGKSTLVAILSGNLQGDSGEIVLDGTPVHFGSARDARSAGVNVVHQHFMLVPSFTVRENLALVGANASVADVNWELDLAARTGSLAVGQQQRIEIIKALSGSKRVVLFDEPTATLTQSEVRELFDVLRHLKTQGIAIVLIAHKLDEALAIADRITVLRHGKVVAHMPREEATVELLADLMVGEVPPQLSNPRVSSGQVVISSPGLDVRAGEIVGVGGVDGNGQVELAEVLAGVRPGGVQWGDGAAPAYIPQDRRRDGLALDMTVEENLLIEGHRLPFLQRWGLLIASRVREWVASLISRFDIKIGRTSDKASSLSGGNQQKIVVARALHAEPSAIVAVNPTRGLDVRAENYVHSQLLAAKERGAAIVLFSTDLAELAKLSDRVLFMSRGELREGDDVGKLLGGVK